MTQKSQPYSPPLMFSNVYSDAFGCIPMHTITAIRL